MRGVVVVLDAWAVLAGADRCAYLGEQAVRLAQLAPTARPIAEPLPARRGRGE